MEFPMDFPLKAIGSGTEDFEQFVIEIVRRHLPADAPTSVTARLSEGGNYLAVTISFVATSRDQLDDIYRELSSHKRVKMLL
jgi:putative lipoic acid-binding regulatory protein